MHYSFYLKLSLSLFLLQACQWGVVEKNPPGSEKIIGEIAANKGQTYLCEPYQEPKQLALHFPSDLAVSQDGQTVYALNGECLGQTLSFSKTIGVDGSTGCAKKSIASRDFSKNNERLILNRRLIYKIQASASKPEIFKVQGKAPLSCVLGTDLEIDDQNRLYAVDEINQRIYRLGDSL